MKFLCWLIGHNDTEKTPSHSTCARCGGILENDYFPGRGWVAPPAGRERWYLSGPSPVQRINAGRMRGER